MSWIRPQKELEFFTYEAFKRLITSVLSLLVSCIPFPIVYLFNLNPWLYCILVVLLILSILVVYNRAKDFNKLLKFSKYADSFSVQVTDINDE